MTKLEAPSVEKKNKVRTLHGVTWSDPWFWLNDLNQKGVREHIEAENSYTNSKLEPTKQLQSIVYQEIKKRLKEDDESLPVKDGPYYYFSKTFEGQQYPSYCRKKSELDSSYELLLDVNELAKQLDYCDVGLCSHSPDHRYLAYAVDEKGDERYTLYVLDLHSGALTSDKIEGVSTCLQWSNDSLGFYYTVLDEHLRPKWVYSHMLGSKANEDVRVFEERDSRFFVSLDCSEDDRHIFIASDGNNMSEWHYTSKSSISNALTLIAERKQGHEYSVSSHEEYFYIRSNHQAKDFKLAKTLSETPSMENWQDVMEARPNTLLEGFVIYQDFMVLQERSEGLVSLLVYDFETGSSTKVPFTDEVYDVSLLHQGEFHDRCFYYSYSSLNIPQSIFSISIEDFTKTIKKKQTVPDPRFSEQNYETKRILVEARDGEKIPVSLVYRKSTDFNATTPLYLYAYGAYGINVEADFSIINLSLIDRGFVYAIAHVRGGMDKSYGWYEGGKLEHKKNTLYDFIDCAEYLTKHGYGQKGQIVASGGSAGGMLMGMVANERPDLFKVIVADVPFVDVLNTMLDDSLPLTAAEYNEWGNPNEKKYFDYIRSYSPYDNVCSQEYPSMFVTAGLTDSRVTYWEPLKWVLKLREYNQSRQDILLRMHIESGHGGASGRYEFLKNEAETIAYILWQFDKEQ